MTVVEILAFAVGVSMAINFFFYAWPRGNQTQMIIACAATIIFATIGVAAHLLARLPNDHKVANQDATRAMTLRGYVQISNFALAVGSDSTTIFFRLTVDGPTYVDIESGQISIFDLAIWARNNETDDPDPR